MRCQIMYREDAEFIAGSVRDTQEDKYGTSESDIRKFAERF